MLHVATGKFNDDRVSFTIATRAAILNRDKTRIAGIWAPRLQTWSESVALGGMKVLRKSSGTKKETLT